MGISEEEIFDPQSHYKSDKVDRDGQLDMGSFKESVISMI